MAKKVKKVKKTAPEQAIPQNALPQNILPVGERVEENKNIYISQSVYKQIRRFTKNKTTDESGGMLIGTVIEEFGKTNIVISGFVEAKRCEATPTTLKFTHDTWEYVHKEIEKKHKGKKILGWIHTHPDFGIFLSEYDTFIHKNFFSEPYQVAYVVDPIQKIEGFYFWINGNLERCKGFYIYDKTGTPITVDASREESEAQPAVGGTLWQNVLVGLLSAAVAFLIFANISAGNSMKALEQKNKQLEYNQQVLAQSANQSLTQMQETITAQEAEITRLEDKIAQLEQVLKDAGLVEEPAPAEPETENTPQEGAVSDA